MVNTVVVVVVVVIVVLKKAYDVPINSLCGLINNISMQYDYLSNQYWSTDTLNTQLMIDLDISCKPGWNIHHQVKRTQNACRF